MRYGEEREGKNQGNVTHVENCFGGGGASVSKGGGECASGCAVLVGGLTKKKFVLRERRRGRKQWKAGGRVGIRLAVLGPGEVGKTGAGIYGGVAKQKKQCETS